MAKINKIKATKKTISMPRFEKQGQSKIINSYGAVGTLIQTINNGSILISDFDTWPFYNFLRKNYQNKNATDYLINNPTFIQDNRLVNRLAKELNINTLLGIFRMPENKYIPQNNTVEEPNRVISASFFPCWFYCPTCGNMNYYIRNNTNPQFPHCHGLPKEQFSFVLISSSGEIAEIPWMEFLRSNPADITIRFSPNNQNFLELNYQTGGSAEYLETKSVSATINGQVIRKSLGTLPSKIFIDGNDREYTMAVRQGNNLCFVKTITSIYIPEYVMPPYEIVLINNNINIYNANKIPIAPDNLFENLQITYPNTATNLNHVTNYINKLNNLNYAANETEEQYRFKEFEFIINNGDYYEAGDSISFKKFDFSLLNLGINNIYRIDKLKVTKVQTGYSRLSPEGELKRIYTDDNILFYPGVEMKGEGMLLELDTIKLNSFLNQNNLRIDDIEGLIHSLSHSVMKELEFECGYKINSLVERLYFGTDIIDGIKQVKYAGVLIYSATGTNSSFGGIASLFENLGNILKIALLIENCYERAQDCPNDPICLEEVSNGNSGVCYSCNLIPETSCEKFNMGLSRKYLNEFFKSL
jgi:hypothetical protein